MSELGSGLARAWVRPTLHGEAETLPGALCGGAVTIPVQRTTGRRSEKLVKADRGVSDMDTSGPNERDRS